MPGRNMMRRMTTMLVALFGVTLIAAEPSPWPQWRGPHRDGISPAKGLSKNWNEQPPALAWTATGLGRGFAGVSLADRDIYTTGEEGGKEFVIALNTGSAKGTGTAPIVRWKSVIGAAGDVGYPGSRCTPTVDGKLLFATTTSGDIACLERVSGRVLWQKSMVAEFGGEMKSPWGFSESPLVDGDRVIVSPGAENAGIVALDKLTGKLIWKSAIPKTGGAAYASLVISEGAGVRQYVTLLGRGLVSVAADDGRFLWAYDKIANGTANIPTPIIRDDYVFASTGYQTGSALLKLSKDGAGVKATEVYFLDRKTLQNHHGGMVLIGDYLYGGHGHNQGFPICIEFETGKVVWRERRGPGADSAAVTFADGNLYFRYQDGLVALVEATPEEFVLKGTFNIPDVKDPSWPHPVIANGLLFLREQDNLYAYDIRAGK